MADYQKPQVRFVNHGMNWSRAVDTIQEDKWVYLKNIRSYQEGTMTSRPGLTPFVTLGLSPSSIYTLISRLNNNNPLAFANNFIFVYVIGNSQQVYVGQTAAVLTNASINPVFTPINPTPGTGQTPFSGHPLSVVDMAPFGADLPFKYIGDSFQNCSVGYYPSDNPSTQMARCISMGILPPVNQTVPTAGGAGNLNGQYQWRFVYRRVPTGAQSNPSAATRVTVASPPLTLTNQSATFTVPTTPVDPQTNAPDTHVVVDIYRFGGAVFRWKLVGSTTSGAAFTDNTADSAILSATEPSQAVNPISGISHFNLFVPFVVPDNAHTGTGNLSQNASGKWIFTNTGITNFNTGWLPGSPITINNASPPFTIFQVISPSLLELTEDASRVGAGTGFPWSTPAGNLIQGTPFGVLGGGLAMRHLWGPWGTGQTGSYIFGCGNPFSPGALFWTNGNDPDSTDTYNSLQVTDPSEPLQNGCVYAGNSYVWSTERMFQIFPSLTVAGQFTVQEIPGGRGIWMEWALTVQTSGFADISVTWRGKDGIYDFSTTGGFRSLTSDDLYPLFPHDNQPGVQLATLFPFLPFNVEPVEAPDDSPNGVSSQKLTWFDGYLFYDYITPANPNFIITTLVYDSRVNGWVSVDFYPFNQAAGFIGSAICRGPEIAFNTLQFSGVTLGNNLKIGIANVLYDYTGSSDNGTAIPSRVVSRADDYGDGRTQKQLGDLMLDVNPSNVTVSPVLRTNYHNTVTALATSNAAVRTQLIESIGTGGGLYSITAGLDITWSASATGNPTLYQYELAYLVKPELSAARATDWDDDGYEGAKFVQGMVIQANTFGSTANLTVQGDCGTISPTFPINTGACEQEIAISFPTPFIAHQMRVFSDIPISMMSPFKIRWIWEPAPELANYWITQGTSFGVRGYFHHRDVLMAIQSTDVVTLTITPDNRPAVTFTFASTGGVLLKPYLSLPPTKARIGQYSATSPTGFRLYVKDVELRIKEWGSTGPWQIVRPFGDQSFQNGAPGGARI